MSEENEYNKPGVCSLPQNFNLPPGQPKMLTLNCPQLSTGPFDDVDDSSQPMWCFFFLSLFTLYFTYVYPEGFIINFPIVCVVLTLDSWNCHSGEQGLTFQHSPKTVQFPLYSWTMWKTQPSSCMSIQMISAIKKKLKL